MDFSHFQNIMEPNDFSRLNKLDKYDPDNLLSYIKEYPKIIDLMSEYFKANPKKINEYKGYHNFSLLMTVAVNHTVIIKNVCELNVNVNYCNENNWTALACAAHNNDINTAKILLEFDASTNIVTKRGKTIFEYGPTQFIEIFTTMVKNIKLLNIKN